MMLFALSILFLTMLQISFPLSEQSIELKFDRICQIPMWRAGQKLGEFIQRCDPTGTHIPTCTHTSESYIAPRAAGRRHGRYKWAGQPVVPSGHKEETHSPAGALRVREGHERKSWRMRDRGERRWWPEELGEEDPMDEGGNGGISEGLGEEMAVGPEVEEALSR